MNRRGNRIDNYYDPSRYERILSERLALKEANIKVVLVYFGEPTIVSGMNTMEKVLASFSFRLATKETREMLLAFSILQRTRFPLLPFFSPFLFLASLCPASKWESFSIPKIKQRLPSKGTHCVSCWDGMDPQIRWYEEFRTRLASTRFTPDETGSTHVCSAFVQFNEHN